MGTVPTYRYTGRKFDPIGDEGLVGRVDGKFVTIKGPCGEGQTMSLEAARQLRDWLDHQPEISGHPVVDGEALPAEGARQ